MPRLYRKIRQILRLLGAAVFSFPNSACAPKASIVEKGVGPGHIVMLPGVEGNAWQLSGVKQGLRDAGLDWTIEIIPWGSPPFHSLVNLTDLPANLKRADRIAARLAELCREKPDAKLVLVGYSGGGGLAMLTVNVLPDDLMLDRIVLVAGAISNDYDTSKAERHCRDTLVNIYSPRDGIVGWGTSVFGTIDRKKVISAGHSGFVDASGRVRESPKLLQIGWNESWQQYGHGGSHVCYLYREWAKHVLAKAICPGVGSNADRAD
ncbi:MAG: hypothetical protein IPK83_19760 [Planctomycetes bacterium]|nr:hypothetical protein [Planctomycetota bacterium]